ncbi:MAG: hypothetical protein HY766_00325 [candidate division NC10 bacterium]|nr:hypothetical protein [candidate division NC10 bacterium]
MSKQKQRGAASKKKGPLDRLTGDEAVTVLRLLWEERPELRKEVERLAKSVLGGVSVEDVADAVEDAVRSLDLDDLSSRAGRHRDGYVEPSQAAVDLVEEAVMPFIEDIKRRAEARQQAAALNTCVGVVLGLYRLRNREGDPFLGWAADSPDEMAGEAVVTLRKALRKAKTARGGPQGSTSLPVIFRETAPEWADMLERCWRRPS